jgi:tetratricopeptide (TPR) repeat protein
MFPLKPLALEAVPGALAKVERYRLLNEPEQAESICRDVLDAAPGQTDALVMLILTLSDQFAKRPRLVEEALAASRQLTAEYERAYYTGMIWERRARARYELGGYGSTTFVHTWFQEAMSWFEKAEALRPPGNDEALLRWNTCARFLNTHPEVQADRDTVYEPLMLE